MQRIIRILFALLLAPLAACNDPPPAAAKATATEKEIPTANPKGDDRSREVFCEPSIHPFWKKFRAAVLAENLDAIADMTEFPLAIHRNSDEKLLSREEFMKQFPQLLRTTLPLGTTSMKELIRETPTVGKDECDGSGELLNVGYWHFQMREGVRWRFDRVDTDTNNFPDSMNHIPLHLPPSLPGGDEIKAWNSLIRYKGQIVGGAKWHDRNGENLLVLTQTGKIPSRDKCVKDEICGRDAEIYAYHYVVQDGTPKLLWKLTDFVRDCGSDLYAGFILKSVSITDLDSDGVSESTFLYKLSCRSDVFPSGLKLIMHEGTNKFAIRGSTKLQAGYGGGEMEVDPALNKAGNPFKRHALEQWKKFVSIENFEQF